MYKGREDVCSDLLRSVLNRRGYLVIRWMGAMRSEPKSVAPPTLPSTSAVSYCIVQRNLWSEPSTRLVCRLGLESSRDAPLPSSRHRNPNTPGEVSSFFRKGMAFCWNYHCKTSRGERTDCAGGGGGVYKEHRCNHRREAAKERARHTHTHTHTRPVLDEHCRNARSSLMHDFDLRSGGGRAILATLQIS